MIQANDLLEYRNKIINPFKDGTFSFKSKKTDNAAYNYVKGSIQEIKSMSEKINLSLFEEFFESSSPRDYAKMLINTIILVQMKHCEDIAAEIEDRISNLKERK